MGHARARALPVPNAHAHAQHAGTAHTARALLPLRQGVPRLNPYINYPFTADATAPLTALADSMHAGG